jgi:hypothetical protein
MRRSGGGWVQRFAFELFENGDDVTFDLAIYGCAADIFALRL